MPINNEQRVKFEDLYDYQLVSDCQISPDGSHLVFCLQRVDKESEKKFTNLWIVSLRYDSTEPNMSAAGRMRQLTFGDHKDTRPRWSPDSSQLAFFSNRADEKQSQILLLPMAGGEARPITDMKGEFDDLVWSPDGLRLVCRFRRMDQEAIDRDSDPRKKELGIIARHINRPFFKLDGTGYLPQDRWHLWIVDTVTGETRQLTKDETYDDLYPQWSADGKEIFFLSNRTPDPDLDPEAVDLFAISIESGEVRRLDTPVGSKSFLSISPDGRRLAYIGREGRGDWWKNNYLWVVPADGSRSPLNLTGRYDIQVGNSTIGDVSDRPTVAPVWSADGRHIYFQLSRHGNTEINTIAVDGENLRPVVDQKGVAGSFSIDRSETYLACCFNTLEDPGQVYLHTIDDDAFRPLTSFNSQLLKDQDLGQIEEVWFKGADGNDLQGWILTPPDFDPNTRYPSILEIHGGPRLQYGNQFMHEFYALAAQGYVVYFCNPRGGMGYGESHSRPLSNNWGTVDYADVMAWADFLAKKPYVDAARMGVAGGSYGGFMTSWIIGHTNRFKAAVAQRVVTNLVSMWGSSDLNWYFQVAFGGKPPWENVENFLRQSPISHIGDATTPTLVIHSEKDMRCDLEQGLQLYVALKYLGVDTELVLFPEESHGLSRNGRTDRRIVRLKHILRWFNRYLKAEEPNMVQKA